MIELLIVENEMLVLDMRTFKQYSVGNIRLGTGYKGNPILDLRLVEIRHGNSWYRLSLLLNLSPMSINK